MVTEIPLLLLCDIWLSLVPSFLRRQERPTGILQGQFGMGGASHVPAGTASHWPFSLSPFQGGDPRLILLTFVITPSTHRAPGNPVSPSLAIYVGTPSYSCSDFSEDGF